jgi:hypothetical protein
MCVCVCVVWCGCVCGVWVCVCVCLCVCVRACTYSTCACACAGVWKCCDLYMCTRVRVCARVCARAHVCVCVCVCMKVRWLHTPAHTCRSRRKQVIRSPACDGRTKLPWHRRVGSNAFLSMPSPPLLASSRELEATSTKRSADHTIAVFQGHGCCAHESLHQANS